MANTTNSITTDGPIATLPAHAVGNSFFTVLDLHVTQDIALVMPAGNDGQKIGLRVWSDVSGWQVTWPDNMNGAGIISTGQPYFTNDDTTVDYYEFIYVTAANTWVGLLQALGITIL